MAKVYTEAEMQAILTNGYFGVPRSLWDYIPAGSHVRYVQPGVGARAERFKAGGYVRNHFSTHDGRKMMVIENKPGGTKTDPSYVSFHLEYSDIEEIWKRYDKHAFIEIHMTFNSLAQKKRQIEDLTERVRTLERLVAATLSKLENRK